MPGIEAINASNMALDTADRYARNTGVAKAAPACFDVSATDRLDEVEADWRRLEAQGIESPGQSFDFISTWIEAFDIPEADRKFIAVRHGGKPLVIMALHRTRSWGMQVWETFPGGHVGTNAPLVDTDGLSVLSPIERAAVWDAIAAQLSGAHMAYLCCIPEETGDIRLFDEFGLCVAADRLHRAQFVSWEQCDAEQRSRSRRKHDKQQGAKLTAMGDVTFEVLGAEDDVEDMLAQMFRQRSERFAQQGIADPFASDVVQGFYRKAFQCGGALKGRLHVLRLDGQVVAVRYNLIHGSRMFCLISSMSIAPEIQPGSPGKQCLLRVMQTEFDAGTTIFDMGSGLTDEKRHWCNVHIPMRHHYVPLTAWGHVFAQTHRAWQRFKVSLKSNKKLFALYKSWRIKVRGRSVG